MSASTSSKTKTMSAGSVLVTAATTTAATTTSATTTGTPSIIDAANLEAQQDEMTALTSILDSTTFIVHEPCCPGAPPSGCMIINVSLPSEGIKVTTDALVNNNRTTSTAEVGTGTITGTGTGTSTAEAENVPPTSFHAKYLPALALHFTLPSGYPLQDKPKFTLSACWLDRKRLSALCRKLDSLWEENKELNAILFVWYSFLKEDIFDELGLVPEYDISWWYYGPRGMHNRDRHRSGMSSKNENADDEAEGVHVITIEDDRTLMEAIKSSPLLPGPGQPGYKKMSALEQLGIDPSNPAHGRLVSLLQTEPTTVPKTKLPKDKEKEKPEKTGLDPRAVVDWLPISSLLAHLASYNEETIEQEFTQYSHSCEICFSDVAGTECVKFPGCGHIFCKPCVRSYYVGLITEGTVDGVKCPGYQCKNVPTPNQVLAVVGAELFERYDRLLLQRTLDSMEDVLYCPRAKCHAHVLYDPNEKMATCSSCRYVFCSICKMVYHGVEPCRFKSDEKQRLFEQYTSGDTKAKKELEKTYGKKQLSILVQTVQSEQWVSQKSKPCPHCQVPIEKFEGCNKVTCFKCNTYFCWNCSAQLDTKNPYFHFNDPNSACFNTLFEGVVLFGDDGDDDDDDDEDDWDEFDDEWDEDEDEEGE